MQRSLTNYHIKLLAAVLMVIDHTGVIFFPNFYALRAIGRFSFPLFAWLLAQGEEHTHNIRQYVIRLLLWGAISQPIYMLAFKVRDLNILFTLLLGLLCLRAEKLAPHFQIAFWMGAIALGELASVDYGGYGVALIALIAKFSSKLWWWLCWVGVHLVLLMATSSYGAFQFPVIFAPLLLLFVSHQQGAKARWFYLFYPLHLLVLFLIKTAIAP